MIVCCATFCCDYLICEHENRLSYMPPICNIFASKDMDQITRNRRLFVLIQYNTIHTYMYLRSNYSNVCMFQFYLFFLHTHQKKFLYMPIGTKSGTFYKFLSTLTKYHESKLKFDSNSKTCSNSSYPLWNCYN